MTPYSKSADLSAKKALAKSTRTLEKIELAKELKPKSKKIKKATLPVVLVVDVGNSHTVIGIFRGEEIVEYWRLTTIARATSDEVLLRISGLVNQSGIAKEEVTHIGLSTVVPMLERPFIKALHYFINKPVQVVSDRNCLGLGISYPNPSLLGADRICNVLGLKAKGLEEGIVVDMGTATSFDVMQKGRFIGGVIVPGINASLDVLTQNAARLMPVNLEWPKRIIANNTDDALRAGLLYGFTGQLEYLLGGIRSEMKAPNAKVFATGGWSAMLREHTKAIDIYDPYLTLKGIREVALYGQEEAQ